MTSARAVVTAIAVAVGSPTTFVSAQTAPSLPVTVIATERTLVLYEANSAKRFDELVVPAKSISAVVINGDGTAAYVVDPDGNRVIGVDLLKQKATAAIATEGKPTAIGVIPNRAKGYIGTASGHLQVFDTTRNTIVAYTVAPAAISALAVSGDSARAYILEQKGTLFVVDPASDKVTKAIKLADEKEWSERVSLILSPDGSRLFAFDHFKGRLVVVDTTRMSVTRDMSLFTGSVKGVSIAADGAHLYVAVTGMRGRYEIHRIRVLDTMTLEFVKELGFDIQGQYIRGIHADAGGRYLYVREGIVYATQPHPNSYVDLSSHRQTYLDSTGGTSFARIEAKREAFKELEPSGYVEAQAMVDLGRLQSPAVSAGGVACNPKHGKRVMEDQGGGTLWQCSRHLEWTQSDNGKKVSFEEARGVCESRGAEWRLPTQEELWDLVYPIMNFGQEPQTYCGSQVIPCLVDPGFRLESSEFWSSSRSFDDDPISVDIQNRTTYDNRDIDRDLGTNVRALCVREQLLGRLAQVATSKPESDSTENGRLVRQPERPSDSGTDTKVNHGVVVLAIVVLAGLGSLAYAFGARLRALRANGREQASRTDAHKFEAFRQFLEGRARVAEGAVAEGRHDIGHIRDLVDAVVFGVSGAASCMGRMSLSAKNADPVIQLREAAVWLELAADEQVSTLSAGPKEPALELTGIMEELSEEDRAYCREAVEYYRTLARRVKQDPELLFRSPDRSAETRE